VTKRSCFTVQFQFLNGGTVRFAQENQICPQINQDKIDVESPLRFVLGCYARQGCDVVEEGQ
jgi:hypothetical protein